MVGVSTLFEAMQRGAETNQVTFTTTTLAGGQTHELTLGADDPKIDSVNYKPSDSNPPSEGILFIVRPLVDSGSTDTDFVIHEQSQRNDIDQVLRIENMSVNDGVASFQPGSGTGVPFQNQDGDEEWYLTLDELSGNDSEYTIRMRWFDISD